MTPKQREAAERLVFEQWYDSQPEGRINPWDVWQAASSRRELLAEPVQEPVAVIHRNASGQIIMRHPNGGPFDMSQHIGASLYAAPQQRKPLSADQIRDAVNDHAFWATSKYFIFRIARAIERAHGITGEQK